MTLFESCVEQQTTESGEAHKYLTWRIVPLSGVLALQLQEDGGAALAPSVDASAPAVFAPHAGAGGRASAFLMTAPGAVVFVNGLPAASLTALQDGDEIALSASEVGRVYYTTDAEPEVVPYEETAEAEFCPRSKQRLHAGMPVVHCPGCGHPYLQSAEVPAYTYAEECEICHRASTLGLSWHPPEARLAGSFDLKAVLRRHATACAGAAAGEAEHAQ